MSRILRYQVPVDDRWLSIRVPRGGAIHVGCRQSGYVEFWAHEREDGYQVRAYRVFGTGQPCPEVATYEGTAVDPGGYLIWHLMSVPAEAAS